MKNPKDIVRQLAKTQGFDVAGFVRPELSDYVQQGLKGFLDSQYHGDMGWMESRAELRASPEKIWEGARSVIVLGQNYAPLHDPMALLGQKDKGVISVYAQGDDYHDVIKKKLKALAQEIIRELGGDARVYVDTAPVMEKPLAQQAGIGWQGKHTCLVSREYGSWLFLGEIFTSLDLEPDEAEENHCGTCTSCIDICPTQAITAPGVLDARRCISYLTIEHKGMIAKELRPLMGNRIYGCDDCLAVCPWNKFAQEASETAFHPRDALKAPLLADLIKLDDAAFRELFRKSPVKRIGRDRFIRNVLIAAGNAADADMLGSITPLLADESPLVRATAVWAFGRLASMQDYVRIRDEHMQAETDASVLQEWKENLP